MPITIGDGGNRTITSITIGDSGNKTVREAWVGDGGVNRLVFAAVNLLGSDPSAVIVGPGTATATYTLTSGGLEQATNVANSTWLTVGEASDYDVMLTNNSGTVPTGAALATWLNLGSSRLWQITRGSVGINTSSNTVQIRLTASGAVVATANVTFSAEVT